MSDKPELKDEYRGPAQPDWEPIATAPTEIGEDYMIARFITRGDCAWVKLMRVPPKNPQTHMGMQSATHWRYVNTRTPSPEPDTQVDWETMYRELQQAHHKLGLSWRETQSEVHKRDKQIAALTTRASQPSREELVEVTSTYLNAVERYFQASKEHASKDRLSGLYWMIMEADASLCDALAQYRAGKPDIRREMTEDEAVKLMRMAVIENREIFGTGCDMRAAYRAFMESGVVLVKVGE